MKPYFVFLCLLLTQCTYANTANEDSLKLKGRNIYRPDYKNSITFSGTNYYFSRGFRYVGELWFPLDDQVGINYTRAIDKHWAIKVGYNQWNNLPWYGPSYDKEFSTSDFHSFEPGTITSSLGYKMAEVFAQYSYAPFKKWRVRAELGISYTAGTNAVIDSVYHNPEPPHDFIIYDRVAKAHYWGVVPAISVDYLCFRKRISIGGDVRYRRYFDFYFHRIEYGFHVGLNF
ncbi:MAG: hypothetical protein H0X33_12170 [Taibaiella sp.]|nr:hypothetical protein [Taibaiella sp.]